jgi:hypothetical protein
MIYYQKSLIKKGKVELYGYTSYDLWWADESGIGLLYTLPNRRKKKTKSLFMIISQPEIKNFCLNLMHK